MWGLGGNDLMLGGSEGDRYDGGLGIDTASFAASPAPVSANLTAGTAFGEGADVLVPGTVENLVGTRFNDLLVGNAASNSISGLTGIDRMFGLSANDLLVGSAGNDLYNGGIGTDTASFAGSPAPVSVNLTAGTSFGEGADVISLGTVERVVGSRFNDLIVGNALPNVLNGQLGHDRIWGLGGNDSLLGSSGNDLLNGGVGNDLANGSVGFDACAAEVEVSCEF
jgi:Ca2+-binding RTX toxin-like protein